MSNLPPRLVDTLKSENLFFAAGALSFAQGHDRAYGCHFGFKSTVAYARAEFYAGYDAAAKQARA